MQTPETPSTVARVDIPAATCLTFQDVADHDSVAGHGPPHAAGEAHHPAAAAAQGADAVQRAWDARPVVAAKLSHCGGCGIKLLARHLRRQAQQSPRAHNQPLRAVSAGTHTPVITL